jgi:type IV secretion system protein VirB10
MSDNEENMNPEASPGEQSKSGVRKVNNVPLYLLAAAVGGFLLIMMLVASDRAANQNKPPEEKALETVAPATNFAAEIAGQHETGIIEPEGYKLQPPAKSEATPSPEVEPSTDYYVPHQQADLNPTDRNSGSLHKSNETGIAGITEDDLLRFQMMRLQLLEQAVKSKTAVTGFRAGSGSTGVSGGFTGSPQSQLAAVRGQLDSLASNRSADPTQAYKDKLEQLKGMMSGVGGATANTDILGGGSSGNSGDNVPSLANGSWRLNSTMDTPETPYVLRAGFVIPGLMISGINSELPGQIMAQVSQDVYDTATGKYILIPQGSRLVGAYSAQVAYGQSRVLVAWDRIIFPDGKALDIAGMKGADSAGYAGYKDKVNTHFWRVFSSAFLMSGIVAGVNLSQDTGGGDALSDRQRASDAMSEALGQQLGQAMTQMIMKNLNIAPTIEIRPGYRFNIMVSKDMVFTKPFESFDY